MDLIKSISEKFRENPKLWFVGGIFTITGLILALLIPFFVIPSPGPDDILTSGKIIDYAVDDDTKSEIYSYQTPSGEIQAHNGIWSTSPSYKIGDRVEVYYSQKDPEHSWINNDKNLLVMVYVLRGLGLYFALLGLGIIVMMMRSVDNVRIEVIVGAIGAFSYGIPASLALPVMYLLFLNRPNFMFENSVNVFPQENLIIGVIFMVTGLLDIAGVLFLLRHYKKTGSNSISTGFEL